VKVELLLSVKLCEGKRVLQHLCQSGNQSKDPASPLLLFSFFLRHQPPPLYLKHLCTLVTTADMVNTSNPGLLMWLVLIVPFRAPCWPHCPAIYFNLFCYIGWRSILRSLVLGYINNSVIINRCWCARGSPKPGILWLVTVAAIQTLFCVAATTEIFQSSELSNIKSYHDGLLSSFKVECLIVLSLRLVFGAIIRIPGPLPAKFTFFWQAWHLARDTCHQAVLQARQTYGTITGYQSGLRSIPYANSRNRNTCTPRPIYLLSRQRSVPARASATAKS
jgi:hypothetical protein